MNIYELISEFRLVLADIKKSGGTVVPILNLENYLDDIDGVLKDDVKGGSINVARENFERDIEILKIKHNVEAEGFRAVMEAGLSALKSSIIINGSAALALLTFIGGAWQRSCDNFPLISSLGKALFIFVLGVGFSGVASGMRYLSQAAYQQNCRDMILGKVYSVWIRIGNFFRNLTIILAVVSYFSFFYGAWLSYVYFSH